MIYFGISNKKRLMIICCEETKGHVSHKNFIKMTNFNVN